MSIALAGSREQASEAAATHLIDLLDKQPACLMRVALDGTLLAANDVALALLRAAGAAEVLETSFAERFLPGQADMWQEFCARVWKSGSGSLECELTDLSRTSRPVQLHAVARRGHPDGIESLFLTIRDASATRRLEEAVREAARVQARADEQACELELARAEAARLSSELAALEERFAAVSLLAQQLADAVRTAPRQS